MGPEGGMEEWEGEGRRSWRSTSEFEYRTRASFTLREAPYWR